MRTYYKSSEIEEVQKRIRILLEKISKAVICVEGKRDRKALSPFSNAIVETARGIKNLPERIKKFNKKEVVVLTDLDKKGNQLSAKIKEELEPYGYVVDVEARLIFGELLKIKYFEEFEKKIKEIMEV